MASLFAGTSGFAYPSWKPEFYPAKLPAKKFLEYYSTRLNSVEVNYTFRRLPAATTLQSWIEATPAHFQFAPKAPMRVTHIQKLKDSGASTEIFLRAIDPLRIANKLGPVLFQLAPTFKCDAERLAVFVRELPKDVRFAFEFRHASWLCDAVYDLLREHNISLCLAESEKLEIPDILTADFAYFRLRKPEYSEEDREAIAAKTRKLTDSGKDVYVFFKHEDTPQGALYAEELVRGFGARIPG